VEVWRDPHCGCCADWADHLRREGFAVKDRVVPTVAPIRMMLGTPAGLLSCHAARVAGFALEGHVPAVAIRRLIAERPGGSPGMEMPGHAPETYDVIAWSADGTHRPFMRFIGVHPA